MHRFLYSYAPLSEGAKMLAQSLHARRVKHTNSRFKGTNRKWVINWGSSELPEQVGLCRVINHPKAVYDATRKTRAFMFFKAANVRHPDWTANRAVAYQWINEGTIVLCRSVETGRGGKGITIAETPDQLIDDCFYVKYIPKKEEWRVHVVFGKIVDIQKKLSQEDREIVEWKIRNHDNGFVFRRYGIRPPVQDVLIQAVRAVDALGLDFGAVDVIYNEKNMKAYVLEVNTAPGLEGETVEGYRTAFEEFFRENG